MTIRELLKKILPLPAEKTRQEFSKLNSRICSVQEDAEAKLLRKADGHKEEADKQRSAILGYAEDAVSHAKDIEAKFEKTSAEVHALTKQIDALQKGIATMNDQLEDASQERVDAVSAFLKRNVIEHLDCHIVDHCNLNCRGCSVYSPLAEKGFADIKMLKKDLSQLNALAGDGRVLRIHILGGEPLLHPELEEIVRLVRNTFRFAQIDVTTNGLLVFAMPDSFWETMRDCNVAIKYTQYPVKFDYENMISYVNEKGVEVFSAGSGEIKYFRRIPLDPTGKHDIYQSYVRCPYSNCTQLYKGVLYRCPAAAFSDRLNCAMENKEIRERFRLSEFDSLILDKSNAKDGLFEFLSTATPFCRYCDMKHIDQRVQWGHSTHDLHEWVNLSESI